MTLDRNSQAFKDRVRAQAEHYIDSCAEYTSPFERAKFINNWVAKDEKSDAVVDDFRTRAGEVKGKHILEIGFGNAAYIGAFARAGGIMHGLEVNKVLHSIGVEHIQNLDLSADLEMYDGVHFPYPDRMFDHLYMISVLEHVSDASAVMREASRVLKPGGTFYISFPNRLAPKETHTGIWFIAYLPLRTAEHILRSLFGRNTVEELNLHFLSFWSLRQLVQGTSLKVVYETKTGSGPRRLLKQILALLGIHHSAILKTVMVVLRKT